MTNQQPEGTSPNPTPQGGFPQPGTYGSPQPYPQQGSSGYTPPAPAYGQPAQPGYGGQPAYGQPAAPQQPADNPYQITHYAAQYGAQGTPQAPYPPAPYQTQPYPPASGWQPGQPEKRSPILGIVAFVLVAIALVASLVSLQPLVQLMSNLIIATGSTTIDSSMITQQMADQFAGPATMVFGVSPGLGLVALILGIVAMATRRGRLWGVIALVLAILGPIIVFTALMMGILPAAEAVQ